MRYALIARYFTPSLLTYITLYAYRKNFWAGHPVSKSTDFTYSWIILFKAHPYPIPVLYKFSPLCMREILYCTAGIYKHRYFTIYCFGLNRWTRGIWKYPCELSRFLRDSSYCLWDVLYISVPVVRIGEGIELLRGSKLRYSDREFSLQKLQTVLYIVESIFYRSYLSILLVNIVIE